MFRHPREPWNDAGMVQRDSTLVIVDGNRDIVVACDPFH